MKWTVTTWNADHAEHTFIGLYGDFRDSPLWLGEDQARKLRAEYDDVGGRVWSEDELRAKNGDPNHRETR